MQNRIKKEVGKKKSLNLILRLVWFSMVLVALTMAQMILLIPKEVRLRVKYLQIMRPGHLRQRGGGSVSTYNGGTTYSNNYSENTGNYVQEQGTTTPTYNNNGSGVTTYSTVPAAQ